MTEGMLKMMGVFAEMKRNMISDRVKSGMTNVVAKRKNIGRSVLLLKNHPVVLLGITPNNKNNNLINVS